METHPVPKNVLTVEFKLFGALSARQFFKVLGACVFGLVLFASPIDKIISIPLIFVVVIVGVASALLPDFGTRFNGVMRAVFVSPRYVWKKENKAPSVLQKDQNAAKTATIDKQKKLQSKTPNQVDVSIDRLLDARAAAGSLNQSNSAVGVVQASALSKQDSDEAAAAGDHFDRMYSEVFGSESLETGMQRRTSAAQQANPVATATGLASAAGERLSMGPNTQITVNSVKNDAPRQEVVIPSAAQTIAQVRPKLAEEAMEPKRYLYGVVVTREDRPIDGVAVSLLGEGKQRAAGPATSSPDGRFALDITGLENGEYIAHIQHPAYKFYEFRAVVDEGKLPGYKFRAK